MRSHLISRLNLSQRGLDSYKLTVAPPEGLVEGLENLVSSPPVKAAVVLREVNNSFE